MLCVARCYCTVAVPGTSCAVTILHSNNEQLQSSLLLLHSSVKKNLCGDGTAQPTACVDVASDNYPPIK